jgi:hypothetical protein
VLEEEPTPLIETRPDLPPALEQAVMRCLVKDPSLRFADAAELAAELAPFGRHAVYYAHRCATLLSKELPRQSTPPRKSEPPPSAEVLRLRLSTGAQAVRRLPTNAGDPRAQTPASQRAVRRSTLSSVPSPSPAVATPQDARPASIEVAAAVVPMPAQSLAPVQASVPVREVSRPSPPPPPAPVPVTVTSHVAPVASALVSSAIEDEDLDFVPGLRPRKARWFVFTASVCFAAGLAYLAIVGLDRVAPVRPHVKSTTLTKVEAVEATPAEIHEPAAAALQ